MSYSDLIATGALIITIVGSIFAYVSIPADKRAEGWSILAWAAVAAATLFCLWKIWVFANESGAPSRRDIINLVTTIIFSLVGWMMMWGYGAYALYRRMNRE